MQNLTGNANMHLMTFNTKQFGIWTLLEITVLCTIHICAVRSRLLQASRSFPTKSWTNRQLSHFQKF